MNKWLIYPTKKKKKKKRNSYSTVYKAMTNKKLSIKYACLKFLSVMDKYLGYPNCMQNLFFFNCMHRSVPFLGSFMREM